MRFKKVLLVYPAYRSTNFTMPVVPLGLGYIAEFLKINGIEYHILDLRLGYKFTDLENLILNWKPDLIGISLMSFMYQNHYKLIQAIKEKFPSTPIVAGGPHISTIKSKVLEECPAIDFAVMQEGEMSLVSLCQDKEFADIPGLLYRDGKGNIISNHFAEVDLDKIPFPRYENFELKKYGYGISIVSSRGCPYSCIYCTASVTRKKFRARSANNVADEMEYWYQRGYREFDLQEDNPTFDRERILRVCDEIETRKMKEIVIMCGNGVRADKVNREILKRMKEVGFKRLGFGVEAGNNKVLKSIKKGETIEVIKKAIQEACDLGFFVSLFFIVGSPTETFSDVEDSIELAKAYPISHVNFFNLIPLPATELFNWVEKNKYFLVDPDVYLNMGGSIQMSCEPVFETPYFKRKERIRALKKGKKIERFIKRRTIVNTLNRFWPFNYIIAYVYMLPLIQNIENQLLRSLIYRNTVETMRNKIRLLFYK